MSIPVNIPEEMYKKIEERLEEFGFETVDDYVAFVLEEVLKDDNGAEEEQVFSEEEEEMIKKRLRDLGYLD
jgi:Arc/MetJ-type ribon-helix-helix transcriptional regulator